MESARARSDRGALVGTSKELCEAVALAICTETAAVALETTELSKWITAAHQALDRIPGHGSTTETHIAAITQSMILIAESLNPLRNEVGSGHGRVLLGASLLALG